VTGVNKVTVQRSMVRERGAPWLYRGHWPAAGDCEAALWGPLCAEASQGAGRHAYGCVFSKA